MNNLRQKMIEAGASALYRDRSDYGPSSSDSHHARVALDAMLGVLADNADEWRRLVQERVLTRANSIEDFVAVLGDSPEGT